MLFDMTFDESILIRVGSDCNTSLQAVLAIGTYIVGYLWCRGEKLLAMMSFFSYR